MEVRIQFIGDLKIEVDDLEEAEYIINSIDDDGIGSYYWFDYEITDIEIIDDKEND